MNMINRFRLNRWLNKISIPNLMTYVVIGMAAVFVLDSMMPGWNLWGKMMLTRSGLMRGEFWRLVTFIFLPPDSSVVFIIFSLYFYWMIGTALENAWGSARFTLFYLIGMIGNIIAALITGYAGNSFLNMSLYFAFAAMNPNYQLMLFFIIPVKIKYLALVNAVMYLISFIFGTWSMRLMILLSLANVILFLGGDIMNTFRQEMRYFRTRRNFRRAMRGR